MPDVRPILLVLGFLLSTLGLAMLIPAAADLAVGDDDWQVFLAASITTAFIGASLALTNRGAPQALNSRQAFLLITLTWLVIATFGALPFYYSQLGLSFTDAFFEAMSGITTTGSTVITGLDSAPRGILLWRGLLQWMGGLGIIVMAIAALPALQVGGMQLFKAEGFETSEKILPRTAEISGALTKVYLFLTIMAGLALWSVGMTPFDAIIHSMTTVATGGYSTHDASIGYFTDGSVEYVLTIFMILGSLPFILYVKMQKGSWRDFLKDDQVRWFFGVLGGTTLLLATFLLLTSPQDPEQAVRESLFNATSIMTGTGFSSVDYDNWGSFAVGIFFLIMFVGGCAGSTSCGVKIFRVQVLFETARTQIRRLIMPRGVFTAHFNGRPIPDSVSNAVMNYFFLFFISFVVLALCLSAFGLDFITAASSAGTAIANVGPGLGDIVGPAGNFQSLPDGAKWFMAAGMLLGRLELLGILVLLSPAFWRS